MGIVVDNRLENSTNLVMADDGAGSTVHIPSFIISLNDGNLIKETLKERDVFMKVELSIQHPDNRVEYEFWYSSVFDFNPELLADLGTGQRILGNNTLFTPRVYSHSCKTCREKDK